MSVKLGNIDIAGTQVLYSTSGNNTDGAMTQAATTTQLNLKANDADVVHKTGDETITGRKTISNDFSIFGNGLLFSTSGSNCNFPLSFQLPSITKGSIPSSRSYCGIDFYGSAMNAHTDRIGLIEFELSTDKTSAISMRAYNCDSSSSTESESISIYYPAGGIPYCTFPKTNCVDGQWVYKYLLLANNFSMNSSSGIISYSLSNYLPNDGYKYEVNIGGLCETEAKSGRFISIVVKSDISDVIDVCSCRTRTSSLVDTRGTTILPIGTGRYVQLVGSTSSNYSGKVTLAVYAYRRIGTNT